MMIDIPKEDYIHKEENGRMITYCTLRQQLKHFIGLDWLGEALGITIRDPE